MDLYRSIQVHDLPMDSRQKTGGAVTPACRVANLLRFPGWQGFPPMRGGSAGGGDHLLQRIGFSFLPLAALAGVLALGVSLAVALIVFSLHTVGVVGMEVVRVLLVANVALVTLAGLFAPPAPSPGFTRPTRSTSVARQQRSIIGQAGGRTGCSGEPTSYPARCLGPAIEAFLRLREEKRGPDGEALALLALRYGVGDVLIARLRSARGDLLEVLDDLGGRASRWPSPQSSMAFISAPPAAQRAALRAAARTLARIAARRREGEGGFCAGDPRAASLAGFWSPSRCSSSKTPGGPSSRASSMSRRCPRAIYAAPCMRRESSSCSAPRTACSGSPATTILRCAPQRCALSSRSARCPPPPTA